jgi:nucleoside-triphosphatase THEP1
MELFSRKFTDASVSLFEQRDDVRIVCTVPAVSNHAFVKALKNREDKLLIEVSQ